MLNDRKYVQESLNSNLYYLRTLREFCANIEVSCLSNNINYRDQAKEIAKECEILGDRLMKYADGRITQSALDHEIFVTPYTYSLELLTEKLFPIEINTNITKNELELTAGDKYINEEIINEITSINQKSLEISAKFTTLCKTIHQKVMDNTLFFYSYPTFFEFMIYEIEIFIVDLKRLLNKDLVDPIFAINYEFLYTKKMITISTFLSGLIDPKYQEKINQVSTLTNQFSVLQKKYQTTSLTPSNQKELTMESIRLIDEFQKFIKNCIEDLLNKNIQLIVEPIFLDNMLTEVNYYRYILNVNEEKQQNYN